MWKQALHALPLSLFLVWVLGAQIPTEPKVKPLPLYNDALALALAHVTTLPPDSLPYARYLWVNSGQLEDMQATSLTINQLSSSASIVRPLPLKKGPVLVLYLDARHYAPQQDGLHGQDLERWLKTWEELRFDPTFNVFFTGDTLRLAAKELGEQKVRVRRKKWELVPSAPWVQNGQTYTTRWVRGRGEDALVVLNSVELAEVIVANVLSPDVDPVFYEQLVHATSSQAPLVSFDYFTYRALATIKGDDPLFQTLFGGLYYDFTGIGTNFKKGTDLDNLLAQLNIGDVDKGIGYEQLFERLRSDQKVLKYHSDVTDSPREVDIIRSSFGKIGESEGLVRITNDLKRGSIDIGKHPFFNLFKNKVDAHEVFFDLRNGLKAGSLFDGEGKRQDKAPDDVARNFTMPSPRSTELQAYIGCIDCHDAEGSDNYKKITNDAQKLFRRLTVLVDPANPNRSQADLQDRLNAYKGNPEGAYARGRDDYARGVLLATGAWKASKKAQADVVTLAGKRQQSIWRGYDGPVDQQSALRSLGINVTEASDAPKVLEKLLPPETLQGLFFGAPADPRIEGLKDTPITRPDFALIRSIIAGRAKQTLQDLLKKAKKS